MDFSWMAWTLPTRSSFAYRAAARRHGGLEYASPGGNPRVASLRFQTTRGDRLFVSLARSAYIISPGWV